MVQLALPIDRFPFASWVFHPPTRVHVRLLGPCFKTGLSNASCQHLADADPEGRGARSTSIQQRVATGNKTSLYPRR